MDPQKDSLRVVGIVAIVAVLGVGIYWMAHKNPLENTGRVIDTSKTMTTTTKSNVPRATIAVDPEDTAPGIGVKRAWHQIGSDLNAAATGMFENSTYLYVGGDFTQAGNVTSNYIARYKKSDQTWGALPSFPEYGGGLSPAVMQIYNGYLFASGYNSFAKLSLNPLGSSWASIPVTEQYGSNTNIRSMEVFLDKLFVGGNSTATIGNSNVPVHTIAKWDNINWSDAGYPVYGEMTTDFQLSNSQLQTMVDPGNQGYYSSTDGSTWTNNIFDPNGQNATDITVYNGTPYRLQHVESNYTDVYFQKYDSNSNSWSTIMQIPMTSSMGEDVRGHNLVADDNNVYIANVSSDGTPVVVKWKGTGTTLYLLGKELQGTANPSGRLFTDMLAPNNNHLYVSGYFTKSVNGTVDTKYLADWAKTGI